MKGKLLLDGGKLHGSWFHQAVVLVCQHDEEGAFGLVLNKPGSATIGDALVADLPDVLKEDALYVGGPVQASALSYLRTDLFIPDANVMPGLSLDHSLEDLIEMTESYSSSQQIKVFAGYAGWAPGQLDDEMQRKSWLVHPASVDHVFHDDPQNLWRVILKTKGWHFKLLADEPEDITWN